MEHQQNETPVFPSTIGKISKTTDPDGTVVIWRVEDEIRRNESKEKVLLLQRLGKVDLQENEMLRFCYYIIGKTGNKKGRWTWGQYAPFVSIADFTEIISEATRRRWIR